MADRGREVKALAVRLDSEGDVLLAGPALRQLKADIDVLHLLVSPSGAAAAALLPGIDEVLIADVPWMRDDAAPHDPTVLDELLARLRTEQYDEVVVLTSFHQSPLPMALLATWAGVPTVVGTSDTYPGALLDVRHHRMPDGDDPGFGGGHEVEAMQAVVAAAGHPSTGDDRLAVTQPGPPSGLGSQYVVVHPTASVPARGIGGERATRYAEALAGEGWQVVVTGGPDDRAVGRAVTPPGGVDLTGRTTLRELAGVLSGASAVVVGNTGPAHLAAAVGTPVVSLFAPVVPLERWRPWGVPTVVLGDQRAACALTRARACPVPGHPCTDVPATQVVAAVRTLAGSPPKAAHRGQPVPAGGAS